MIKLEFNLFYKFIIACRPWARNHKHQKGLFNQHIKQSINKSNKSSVPLYKPLGGANNNNRDSQQRQKASYLGSKRLPTLMPMWTKNMVIGPTTAGITIAMMTETKLNLLLRS